MHATTATLKKQRMVVECLTDEEQLIAARTSYAYWAMEQLCSDTTSSTSIRMAMREARRHYVGENGDFDRALERFKRSLQWRKERRVDLLRFCFWTSHNDTDLGVHAGAELNGTTTTTTNASMLLQSTTVELSEEDAKVCSQYEKLIERDLQIQPMAVRGHDREMRPIIVKLSRRQVWNSKDENAGEAYFLANLFVAERAIANTEYSSRGVGERVTTFFDFATYSSANSPPAKLIKDTMVMLQANYPERIGQSLVLDAPLWMQAVFKVIAPFLSEKTRKAIAILGSVNSATSLSLSSLWSAGVSSAVDVRDKAVRAVVEPQQAMPFMLQDAMLTSELNIQQLRAVPFHELYDYNGSDSLDRRPIHYRPGKNIHSNKLD